MGVGEGGGGGGGGGGGAESPHNQKYILLLVECGILEGEPERMHARASALDMQGAVAFTSLSSECDRAMSIGIMALNIHSCIAG